jgi:hypothetical protein
MAPLQESTPLGTGVRAPWHPASRGQHRRWPAWDRGRCASYTETHHYWHTDQAQPKKNLEKGNRFCLLLKCTHSTSWTPRGAAAHPPPGRIRRRASAPASPEFGFPPSPTASHTLTTAFFFSLSCWYEGNTTIHSKHKANQMDVCGANTLGFRH